MNIKWQDMSRDYFEQHYQHQSLYFAEELSHFDIDQSSSVYRVREDNTKLIRVDVVELWDEIGIHGYSKYYYIGTITC